MPFDKTPAYSTYQTKSINLFWQQNNRSQNVTSDEDYMNVFVELIKNRELQDQDQYIVKRAGTTSYIASVGAGTVRGMWYNEDFKKLYYCVSSTMYVWDVASNALSATLSSFFSTTTGDVGFCDFLYDNGTTVVVATDGTTLKQIDSANAITACVDADLPSHLPKPVFLDGYIYVVKSNTADIYNSDLNNPLSWTPGNFTTAEIGADILRTIEKLNNYLVAFGSNTIEYFWDAGNASGSPLQRNDTPVKFNGYLGGLSKLGNKLYFLGNNTEDEPNVFVLEDFKMEEVGNQSVVRYLAGLTATYSTIKGSIVGIQGHHFYVINAGSLTYTIDLETKLWGRWAYKQTSTFPIDFAINTKKANGYQSFFTIDSDTTVYKFDPTLYQDSGTTYTCQGVTDNEYFDTYRQKFMSSLVVWCDKPTTTATLEVSWSDDDYQTFNTPVSIQLYQEYPNYQRLGRFRRRAFKWSFTQNLQFRLKMFEVDINMGQY